MVELLEPSVARQRKLLGFPLVDSDIAVGANINASKIGTGVVNNTEFNRLDGITSPLEEQGNKGAISGYAALDASQELLIVNFPSGSALQVLRRNAANTALEFATAVAGGQVDSVVGTLNRISVDATDPVNPIVDIDSGYVGQASITTLGTITTGVWNGTAITGSNINAASTDLTDSANIARDSNNLSFFSATTSLQLLGVISDETGSGLLVFNDTPTLLTPTIADYTNANHDHEDAVGGGQLDSTFALSDTDDIAYLNTPNVYTGLGLQDFGGSALDNIASLTSNATNPATGSIINLGNNEQIGWRNLANSGNVTLGLEAGSLDQLVFRTDPTIVQTTFRFQNNATAAINNFPFVFNIAGLNDIGDPTTYAQFFTRVTNITDGQEEGTLEFGARESGTISIYMRINPSETHTIRFDKDLDMNNNKIANINPTTITDLTTVTAAAGDFIWIIDATDGLSKKVDANDFLGGAGEVFTWTNDHSMDTFKLIAAAGNDVILNAPTGQGVSIEVAGVQQYLFDVDEIDLLGNDVRNFGFLESFNGTAPSEGVIRLGLGDGLVYSEGVVNPRFAFETNFWRMTSSNVGTAALLVQLQSSDTPLSAHVIGGILAQSFSSTGGQINLGGIFFDSVDNTVGAYDGIVSILVSQDGSNLDTYMTFNAAANQTIDVFRNFQTNNNDILLGTGTLQFADVNTTILQTGLNLEYDVATGGTHDWRINNNIEGQLSPTVFNLPNAAFQEAGVAISPIGLHDQYLDAGGFIPVDAGALSTRAIGTGANQKGVVFIPFLTAVTTYATIKIKLPRNYNNGTITAVINWTSETEGAGDVIWGVSGVAVADGDDLAAAGTDYGTEITVTDTQTTIEFSQDTPRTAAITLANVPADADTLYLKVQRRGADGGDTFTQEAQLLGIYIDLTTDAAVSS